MSHPTALYSLARALCGLLAVAAAPGWSEPGTLTLQEAVSSALAAKDPAFESIAARADALENLAIADAQLPDPTLTGQVANVPVDSFDFDQDGMTQAVRIGLRQEFPAGETLRLRGERRGAQADAERARRDAVLREVALATRETWLDLAYHRQATRILAASHEAMTEQLESLAARFATGRLHAQELLRSELELALIDDRRIEHQRQAELARAALARRIGSAAERPLPDELPALSEPRAQAALEESLLAHPRVRVADAQIEAAALGIALAEEAYKPAFALEGGYGLRVDRSDLASVGVTVSLPLFPDSRQDRQRSAAVRERGARHLDRDALLRDLRRQLLQELATWRRLRERLVLYRDTASERARAAARASVTTYANSQTDFADLIDSQLTELDIELKQAELQTRLAKSWARLAWLAGESS
jgi:outer membrane protein TolC